MIGILLAVEIATLWLFSLVLLLFCPISSLTPMGCLLAILGRAFLQTGLFASAHDAIHGSLSPHPLVNRWLGQISLWFYGGLSFEICCRHHWLHHRYPGSKHDPDYADNHPLGWYLNFLRTYMVGPQLISCLGLLVTGISVLHFGAHVRLINLLLFWLLPMGLSSFQLFFFGTYLPHRPAPVPHSDQHRARSYYWPILWSLLTCYHFGYHWEHHEYPRIPWYRLPFIGGRMRADHAAVAVVARILPVEVS